MESSFADLAEKCTSGGLRDIFKQIHARNVKDNGTSDSPKRIRHSPDEVEYIREAQYQEVKAGLALAGISTQSVRECKRSLSESWKKTFGRMTSDGFISPATGIGTPLDPGMWSSAYTPVSMSPEEATSYYSSGGIPKVIIDKKSKGVLLNGYTFEGQGWESDEVEKLHDHAELKGFGKGISEGGRDGFAFGGALLYAALKGDNPVTYMLGQDELIAQGILKKDCIQYFVSTDRWNTVIVPNWDVTAEDYINPHMIYVPIGGLKIATERCALIRPNMLPFWGAIRQLGWGVSDFESWIRSYLSYEIMIMTLPIMFQQMSVLFQTLPTDGMLAQNGPDALNEVIKENAERLRKFSMLHPEAVGSVGDIKTVERHYENMEKIFQVQRQDLAAKSTIPESVIFHTSPTGFSDNEEDILLKQSEALMLAGDTIAPQLSPVARMVAISCFGPDYTDKRGVPLLEKLNTLKVSFDMPIVQTQEKRAESGAKFSQMVDQLSNKMDVLSALDITLQFFDGVNIPETVLNRLKGLPEDADLDGYTPLQAIEKALEAAKELAGENAPGAQMGLSLLESAAARMRDTADA